MNPTLPGEYDVLSLGDSYTIGESVGEEHRWPLQLVAELQERGVQWNQPRIIAKTGWTTDELQSAIDQSPFIGRTYGWVTLLIGVNNQYRGLDAEIFRKDFRELLQYAIERADNRPRRVLVLSIPDWGVTPFARSRDTKKIAAEIDMFNRIKSEETPISSTSPTSRAMLQSIPANGLHLMNFILRVRCIGVGLSELPMLCCKK